MDLSTTWSRSDDYIDVKTLKRYQSLLRTLLAVGEGLVLCLTLAVLVGSVWTLAAMNWENVIFFDGRDRVCVYDGVQEAIFDGN
jgi:hypothetical protein